MTGQAGCFPAMMASAECSQKSFLMVQSGFQNENGRSVMKLILGGLERSWVASFMILRKGTVPRGLKR